MVIYFYNRDYHGNNLCLETEIDLHRIYEMECYLYFLDKVEESKCMKEC